MCELIFLVIAAIEVDEDAKVVSTRCDFDGCSGELGGELVEAVGSDSFRWTGDPKCGYWRMMGSLLGDVGYSNRMGNWLTFILNLTARVRLSSTRRGRWGLLLNVPIALVRN